ncbi:DUF3883 domain-containing protein [Pseudomonas viridiflava]|uniref:DUF3883 domain-containing protein n=1 Tax=Pseudomonas viridiflava TaxID=33069 RepID=UPI0018E5E27E|nr:DUF3883 domain-containing protein [Pseudomonas viridiflava]MBI6706336.1 DUF3883 domain-containing protein [Pseudomonas viridiflava]MBI6723986.1 DUF3883 domain-containing protein [Pseudomonas viridiflava]MEE3932418.1 DUF3883 domain-containing protein [Pseudomonas viridiflava]MEE3943343.1 DUF3883 domain-containing protein [Pseudomonas viridiflava]MEE3968911.1 DUF3883 domain-containing protein [Pseudomonas viridiflava]
MSRIFRLQSPEAVQVAMDEFTEMGREGFLKRYGYGQSRDFLVRNPKNGDLCDSKAIAGVAYGKQYLNEGALAAKAFSGGEKTVVPTLEALGYEIVRIGADWSEEEVDAAVAEYFRMLQLEAEDARYNKTEHNSALRKKLNNRTKGSVEMKHSNISAVLSDLGLPFINGYKPRGNTQLLLRKAVQAFLNGHVSTVSKIVDALEEVKSPGEKNYKAVLVEPPSFRPSLNMSKTERRERVPRRFDYAARDEANRSLGRAGEEWVMGFEKHRLTELGVPELFDQVDWVSDRLGDGAGYDILSLDKDGLYRYIEVKTTNGSFETSFVISHNELEFSQEVAERFYLYRLFQFRRDPKLFILNGDISKQLSLKALDFRASFREQF